MSDATLRSSGFGGWLPAIRTFTVEEKFGSWDAVSKTHFSDGGVYDQITVKR